MGSPRRYGMDSWFPQRIDPSIRRGGPVSARRYAMAAFDTTSWLNTHNPTAGPVSDLGGRWPAHGDPSGSALSDEGATHQVTVGFGKARERCWKANWWVGPLNLPQFSESHLGLQLLRPLTAGDTNSIKRARMADRDDRSSVPHPGESQSVMQLAPNASSSALLSFSNSIRSCMENPSMSLAPSRDGCPQASPLNLPCTSHRTRQFRRRPSCRRFPVRESICRDPKCIRSCRSSACVRRAMNTHPGGLTRPRRRN